MNGSPRFRSVSRARRRGSVAAVGAAALVLVGLGVAPAVADDVTVYSDPVAGQYDLELVTNGDDSYNVTVSNWSSVTQTYGLGATTHTPDAIENLWNSPWTTLADDAHTQLDPGQSYTTFIPKWTGARLVFFRDIYGAHEQIGTYTIPGAFTPFIVTGTDTNLSIQWGQLLTVGSGFARAGEGVQVSTSGLPGTSTELWLLNQDQVANNFATATSNDVTAVWNEDGGRYLGTEPVASGSLSADLTLPTDLSPGDYAVIAGDPVTDLWPAGPVLTFNGDTGVTGGVNLTIQPGAPRSTTPTGSAVAVAPVTSTGATPVQFTFDQVTAPGTTTVTTSGTGPTPTGFSVGGTTATYYDLSTTAAFAGSVQVCFAYDTTGLSPTDPAWQAFRLYHYTGGAWQDITTDAAVFGTLCGSTTSFSPFVIGTPTAPPAWPFTGFLDPVDSTHLNTQFAGAIVPFRFRVGQDRGLNILAAGSPTSGLVPCGTSTAPSSSQPTASALPATLTYVKASNTYWYLWKTSSSWAGTCRTFSMKLADGSVHTASFKFVKPTVASILQSLVSVIKLY